MSSSSASTPARKLSYAHLLPPSWTSTITHWLAEDCSSFDWGGYVVGEEIKTAHLYCKSAGVLAGVPFFEEVFRQIGDCEVQWHYAEGAVLGAISPSANSTTNTTESKLKLKVATVRGPARKLLLGERVALNTLARCSGIATASHSFLQTARSAGYCGIVAGTRKTTPGFRLVEKYGMLVGGVDAHRYDLSSMVMLKDNHIWSSGNIARAVQQARSVAGFSLRIDVEVQNESEAVEAIEAGADVIMLDNLSGDELGACAERLKAKYGEAGNAAESGRRRFLLESSGGIDIDNVQSGGHLVNAIDIISTSSIHQSTKHVDFSLKLDPSS
ncbi:putative BNA6-nicotinate-nucleotide diphosphorylase [Tilletiaria anomala UBC 951]|uniref:Nicotinate-nucleotide pyrophosphorylase [carboxylating] n=1 Tax=Tilletiaria anomala (strain ATCC 24038 / CBS 436.72 / UBC 951) TaxID=1037660 RepID=A0A066VWS6_TILAU|nr:putative BNA6-nicotinate-nucleotide diphosphorylase [Tilletiaria anomala UBC 951]KDN45916.1 putative BNA6-nicotinate-nucleotide diphosphorylase [Tilletiaria anomala UBC 951]